jgi:hypothetical protein
MSFRIEYDDDQIVILNKIENELNKKGINITFKDDDLEHDGYMMFDIIIE